MKAFPVASILLTVLSFGNLRCVESYSIKELMGQEVTLSCGESLQIDDHTVALRTDGKFSIDDKWLLDQSQDYYYGFTSRNEIKKMVQEELNSSMDEDEEVDEIAFNDAVDAKRMELVEKSGYSTTDRSVTVGMEDNKTLTIKSESAKKIYVRIEFSAAKWLMYGNSRKVFEMGRLE